MTNLAIQFSGYVDGVHTVIIKDNVTNPFNQLKDTYSTTSYKNVNKNEDNNSLETFIQSIEEEVKSLPKKRQKKIIKALATIPAMILPFMSSVKTNAQTIQVDFPFLNDKPDSIIPPEIWDILSQLIASAGKIGFLLSILLIAIAGLMIMFGRREKAVVWISEIIKGYGIILVAPILILLLTTLVYLILGNSGLDMFY